MGADARHQIMLNLSLSLSLIETISSGSLSQIWEAVGKNVLLWPVFEGGIVTAAVLRDVDALVGLCTTGGGGNILFSSVCASPSYIRWNKVSAPTCLLCTSGWLAFLLRGTSGIAINLTARLLIESSLPSDISYR